MWDLGQGSLFFSLPQSFYQATTVQNELLTQNGWPWMEMVLAESVTALDFSLWLYAFAQKERTICVSSQESHLEWFPSSPQRYACWIIILSVAPEVSRWARWSLCYKIHLGKPSTLAYHCLTIGRLTSLNLRCLQLVWPPFPPSFIFLSLHPLLSHKVIFCGMHLWILHWVMSFAHFIASVQLSKKGPMLCLDTQVSRAPSLGKGVISSLPCEDPEYCHCDTWLSWKQTTVLSPNSRYSQPSLTGLNWRCQ